nr:ribosome recycling factor [bacterium]
MEDVIDVASQRMQKTLSVLTEELGSLRAGRANPKLLDRVLVDYYGTPTPINQVANISAPEPRMLVISPWDPKMISGIEKAILKSELGITPTNDGKVIRLVVPELTEERRKDLVKVVGKTGEECKVALRNTRRDAMDKLKAQKKAGELTEDDLKSEEARLQKALDKAVAQADKMLADKEKEIMSL